jgi:hypothetical protein
MVMTPLVLALMPYVSVQKPIPGSKTNKGHTSTRNYADVNAFANDAHQSLLGASRQANNPQKALTTVQAIKAGTRAVVTKESAFHGHFARALREALSPLANFASPSEWVAALGSGGGLFTEDGSDCAGVFPLVFPPESNWTEFVAGHPGVLALGEAFLDDALVWDGGEQRTLGAFKFHVSRRRSTSIKVAPPRTAREVVGVVVLATMAFVAHLSPHDVQAGLLVAARALCSTGMAVEEIHRVFISASPLSWVVAGLLHRGWIDANPAPAGGASRTGLTTRTSVYQHDARVSRFMLIIWRLRWASGDARSINVKLEGEVGATAVEEAEAAPVDTLTFINGV